MIDIKNEITSERIADVERLIRPHIRTTPLLATPGSDFGLTLDRLLFKLESCQYAGSFKVRGAFSNLISRELPSAGVVAASGGNHGLAVAFAAHKLGVPAKIFVPSLASPLKIAKIPAYRPDLFIPEARHPH